MKRYDDKTRPKPKPRPRESNPRFPNPVKSPPRPRFDSQTHWDDVAEWYHELVGESGSEYHREVVFPGLVKLLQPRAGMRLLELCCGQGVLCRLMQKRGVDVVGVDASAKLIETAKQTSDPSIAYHVGDARKLAELTALQPESFDVVTNVLAIQNMDLIAPVFEGAARLLKPGGRLLIVMMHPAFRSPKATAWGFEGQDVQYRRIERYLVSRKEPIVCHPGRDDGTFTWTFHRPLQAYVWALKEAGFLVDAIEEWPSHKISQPGPRAYAENFARREIPMFLTIGAIKM